MPFESVPKPDHELMITVPFGLVTGDELLEYYRQRLDDGSLRPGLRELVDGRWIENFDVGQAGQAALVELLISQPDTLEGVRWGFIADSMVSFGVFRMFEARKDDLPFETKVFRTPGAAAEWLKVPRTVLMIDAPV